MAERILIILVMLLFLIPVNRDKLHAQSGEENTLQVKVEQPERGKYVFYATSRNASPYQVELRFFDGNSEAEIRPAIYRIVPANASEFELGTFRRNEGDPQFRYRYRYFFGDPANTRHRDSHVYLLPYRHGETYPVLQGYNGRFSHQNEYSIDFRMPEGTPVHAAREGTVIFVKDDSNRGGPDPQYRADGNYISILHDDGTFAEYVHLRFRGSRVKTGDRVRAGDHIAYSGNTGFSTTPHLHFSVKVPAHMRYDTTPTLFRLENNTTGRLTEGNSYRSVHY
ncbi:MAG: M23 family metallopeptidase [Balneolaceae bacterium]|nr:MAG: M23 family metallopeptidase [Balneolaceae bacterium]